MTDMLRDKFSFSFAIDLGTQNTVVYKCGEGIVFNEPTFISVSSSTKTKTILFGKKAKDMVGKNSKNLKVVQPLKNGALADLDMSRLFISKLISSLNKGSLLKPTIAVSIPRDLTQIERKAVIEACKFGGAKDVVLIEDPFSALVGADLFSLKADGYMIADIGGGVTEVSLVSYGGIVFSESIRVAGDTIDEAIARYLKTSRRFLISPSYAEMLKIKYGSAIKTETPQKITILGKNQKTNMPSQIEIDTNEITSAIEPVLEEFVALIKESIKLVPPDFAKDIYENGILLTGGTALLADFDKYLEEKTNVKIKRSQNPLLDIAIGAGKIISDKKILSTIKDYQNTRM